MRQKLYQECYAPLVLPSGKYSIMKKGALNCRHRKLKRRRMPQRAAGQSGNICRGFYNTAVCRAERSCGRTGRRTRENAIYSRAALDAAGITVKKAILCCQAFHARRALMYYQEQFPETEILVCPIVTRGISGTTWMKTKAGIDIVLGEVERCGGQFHEILRRYADD